MQVQFPCIRNLLFAWMAQTTFTKIQLHSTEVTGVLEIHGILEKYTFYGNRAFICIARQPRAGVLRATLGVAFVTIEHGGTLSDRCRLLWYRVQQQGLYSHTHGVY